MLRSCFKISCSRRWLSSNCPQQATCDHLAGWRKRWYHI